MIRKTPWPAGIPCWADLLTEEFEGARKTYGEAFGWEIPDGDPLLGGYANATRDGHQVVGFMPTNAPGQSSTWTVYLASDDIDATAAAVTANGGTVDVGPMEVPGIVKMLYATDPQGGRFGVQQALGHTGAELTSEPGSIAWEHCVQPDPEAGKAFYGAVFGWVFSPLPSGTDGGYLFAGKAGEPPYGSFGNLGPEAPAGWQVTFGAEDVDAVVATFEAAGGRTVEPAADTPWGRMAMIADASGATFTVMETAGNPQPDRGLIRPWSRLAGMSTLDIPGFDGLIGFTMTEVSGDHFLGELTISPDLHQPYGIVHGGVYCTVIETAASWAGSAWLGDRGQCVGVNNNTNFLRATREGKLIVSATPIHRGRTQQLWQVEVTREDGKAAATGQVRLANITDPAAIGG